MNQAKFSNNYIEVASILATTYSTIMKGVAYGKAILNILTETDNFLDSNINKLEEKAKQCSQVTKSNQANISDDAVNDFIDKITDGRTKKIESKIDTDVQINIIEPLLCEGAQALVRKIGKSIKIYHQSRKEDHLLKKFQRPKAKYEKDKENIMMNYENEADRKKFLDEIKNKYNQNLLVIITKTKNPNLVASIIEEGGPMDMTCIYALVNVFGKPIRINNVDGATFPNLICSQNVNLNHTQDDNYLSIDVILEDGITAFGHFLPSSNMIDN
ncbi:unnamed protein product [Rotaria sordida]|uniref:Uncharacterized protein n=1 Tax=Rotaria sordida TaxID=392033 RepID=A0A814AYU5_9BILA|nr:unnamed protein product [Rotaria sordida]